MNRPLRLPHTATSATRHLLKRWDEKLRGIDTELRECDRLLDQLRHEDDLARIRQAGDREKARANHSPAGVFDASDRAEIQARCEESIAGADAEYQTSYDARNITREQLKSRRRELEESRQKARVWRDDLGEAHLSTEGLAPWDTLAVRANEALEGNDASTQHAETPKSLLTAAQTEQLLHRELGVSRSVFYHRYRPLLRAYHIAPVELVRTNGWVRIRRSTLRFKRAEVEAMLEFLVRAAC